jgi:hypothetical protein
MSGLFFLRKNKSPDIKHDKISLRVIILVYKGNFI